MGKPFVFVLMPFDKAFDDFYQLGIRQAAEDAGAYCERVDEQHFDERILDRIYNQVSKADFIVADMSGKNPNVFYETGYAHALGKKVILLVSTANDIPFDLKHHPHIIYNGDIQTLKSGLKTRLEFFIRNPDKQVLPNTSHLDFHLKGQRLERDKEFSIKPVVVGKQKRVAIPVQIDIENKSDSYFESVLEVNLQSAAFLDLNFEAESNVYPIKILNHAILHRGTTVKKILPHSWDSVKFLLANSIMNFDLTRPFELILKVHTEIGVINTPFFVKLIDRPHAWLYHNK